MVWLKFNVLAEDHMYGLAEVKRSSPDVVFNVQHVHIA